MSESSIYKWTFRDERDRTAVLIDDNVLEAEVRAYDLLCSDLVDLIQVEEVQR